MIRNIQVKMHYKIIILIIMMIEELLKVSKLNNFNFKYVRNNFDTLC